VAYSAAPNAGVLPMKYLDPEDVWLRFFLRRVRLALRNAKSADTTVVLKELIADAEDRLDRLQKDAEDRAAGLSANWEHQAQRDPV